MARIQPILTISRLSQPLRTNEAAPRTTEPMRARRRMVVPSFGWRDRSLVPAHTPFSEGVESAAVLRPGGIAARISSISSISS